MSLLTSRKTYTALTLFLAGDAVACAVPIAPIEKSLTGVNFPLEYRWILVGSKAAAAVGLIVGQRNSALARLTTAMLALYFTLAVGAHVRAHDKPVNAVPAAAFLALFTAMTAKGLPDRQG
jgi:hypothetical protein